MSMNFKKLFKISVITSLLLITSYPSVGMAQTIADKICNFTGWCLTEIKASTQPPSNPGGDTPVNHGPWYSGYNDNSGLTASMGNGYLFEFGDVAVGSSSTMSFTVINSSKTNTYILGNNISVAGDASIFSITSDCPNITVKPLSSCNISIKATPVRLGGVTNKYTLGGLISFDTHVNGVENSVKLKATQIATGFDSYCVLGEDSTPYCWGDNTYGQAGVGPGYTAVHRPTPLTLLAGNVKKVKGYGYQMCAITFDNKVYCWGKDIPDGLGGTPTTQYFPTLISQNYMGNNAVLDIAMTNNTAFNLSILNDAGMLWSLNTLKTVATNVSSIEEGNAVHYFTDFSYQTGNTIYATATYAGNAYNSSSVRAYSLGQQSVQSTEGNCAISNGYAYCWGDSMGGVLGNGSVLAAWSCVNFYYSTVYFNYDAFSPYSPCTLSQNLPSTVKTSQGVSLSNVTNLVVAPTYKCAVSSNQKYCWGSGFQSGTKYNPMPPLQYQSASAGAKPDANTAVYATLIPTDLSPWKLALKTNSGTECFLTTLHTIYCEGTTLNNPANGLGSNTTKLSGELSAQPSPKYTLELDELLYKYGSSYLYGYKDTGNLYTAAKFMNTKTPVSSDAQGYMQVSCSDITDGAVQMDEKGWMSMPSGSVLAMGDVSYTYSGYIYNGNNTVYNQMPFSPFVCSSSSIRIQMWDRSVSGSCYPWYGCANSYVYNHKVLDVTVPKQVTDTLRLNTSDISSPYFLGTQNKMCIQISEDQSQVTATPGACILD